MCLILNGNWCPHQMRRNSIKTCKTSDNYVLLITCTIMKTYWGHVLVHASFICLILLHIHVHVMYMDMHVLICNTYMVLQTIKCTHMYNVHILMHAHVLVLFWMKLWLQFATLCTCILQCVSKLLSFMCPISIKVKATDWWRGVICQALFTREM